MTAFEYLGVFISVIFGLAISHLLSGFGSIIQLRKRLTIYPLHLIFSINGVFYLAANWWAYFQWNLNDDWNFIHFMLLLSMSIALYLISDLLMPKHIDADTDFKKHYFAHHKPIYLNFIIYGILDIPESIMKAAAGNNQVTSLFPLYVVFYMMFAIIGYFSSNEKVHYTLNFLMPLLALLYIAKYLMELT